METVPDKYERLVDEGVLKRDDAQVAVVEELERLRADLAQPQKKGFFRRQVEAPKGLYLWGGVGRGKSMLMDMFVETLSVPAVYEGGVEESADAVQGPGDGCSLK